MKNGRSAKWIGFGQAVLFVFAALLLNIIPSKTALALNLPLFLDSIGTIFAAMLGGNLPAVIVGFCVNAINGISDITTLYYGIISILIGVAAALFQRNGFFKTPGKIVVTIITFSFLGGGLGSVLTYFLFGYDFGEGISAPFALAVYEHLGFSKFFAQLTADIILDVFDKTIVVIAAVALQRVVPQQLKDRTGKLFLFNQDPVRSDEEKLFEGKLVKRSLIRKVVVMVIVAEILLGALASTTGYILYSQAAVNEYIDITKGVSKATSVVVDGDRIDEFLEKGREAEGYADIEKRLYRIKETFPHVMYLYIYRIMEDGSHVIFDLESEDIDDVKAVKADQPGDVVDFDETFADVKENLIRGEKVEPRISDDEFGWLLTSYEPLLNSEGKPVAQIGVDLYMGDVNGEQATFFIKLLSMFFGLSIIIMSVVLEFVNRGIVYPVNRMAAASIHFAYNLEQGVESGNNLKAIEDLKIHTFDEIEYLYRAITKMGGDSLRYIDELNKQTERITNMQEEIIVNFAEMVEARDMSTGNHVKKTAFYVEAIAKELQKEGKFKDILTDSYIKVLKRSAPLHDIGKIAISDLILNKPGRFTEDEFKIMQSHTTEGKNILTKIETNASDMDEGYLKESIEMAQYHHEKWDGTGYPCGVKGDEIPISARIMAVADVFDALVAERVYKAAFPYEKAMEIITGGAGKAFDPDVVEAFTHISKELYDKRTRLEKK
ncbi:HD domain-containing protein [bacterium]|nr:HD domain-containing protein [bacterium]